MRLITKKIRNKIIKSRSTDLRAHMWFRYHKHLFGRLILSGFKIRAFNQLLDLKYSLKLKEKLDPNLVFLVSMIKATPLILLLPVRMGSFTQGIPMPMTEKKQITFAVK